MAHGGEAARPAAADSSTKLGAAQGAEAPVGAVVFSSQLAHPALPPGVARRVDGLRGVVLGGPRAASFCLPKFANYYQVRQGGGAAGHGRVAAPVAASVVQADPSAVSDAPGEELPRLLHGGYPGPVYGDSPLVPVAGRRGGELVRPLRDPNLGDAGAVYGNPRLRRRLLPLVGAAACSVAVSELAGGGPASAAAGFGLSALLFGGLLLIILHVLRA